MLSDDRIAEMMRDTWGCASIAPRHAEAFARSVEAEVRKDDEALMRQLSDALEWLHLGIGPARDPMRAIAAARARLLDSDLSTLTERGAKAWAGVDAQALREAADAQAIWPGVGPDGKEWAKTAAGYQHVDSMVPSADGHERGPYWYGWALRGAFVAGAEWQDARNLTAERATKEGAS